MAIKLRSHDGVNWELDPGVAYTQRAERYTDGTVVDWYKAERPKVVQDAHGRATHLSLAMIDVVKNEDKGNDNHSSKHITLPLVVEGLTEILNEDPVTPHTREIRVRLLAEDGFDPTRDIDVGSLHFGDPKEVNYGRGMRAAGARADGKSLVVTFRGAESGITEESFTGKIIAKRTDGSVYYAYPRLPGLVDDPAVLVALPVRQTEIDGRPKLQVRVKNYGLEKSRPAALAILGRGGGIVAELSIPPLAPYDMREFLIDTDRQYSDRDLGRMKGRFTPKYQLPVKR